MIYEDDVWVVVVSFQFVVYGFERIWLHCAM